MKLIYLDNAETTMVDPKAFKVVQEFMLEKYGLPSGDFGHSMQEEVTEAIEKARETIAQKIGAHPHEIIFTSGATESNNLALQGIALAPSSKGKKIVVSAIEQKSILHKAINLKNFGFNIEVVPVDSEGFIDLNQVNDSIDDSRLVSIQHANQEIGTIQDIKSIGNLCRSKNVLFHCDAAQSFTKLNIDVNKMNIDLLSITSHLIHGPKGVGALYVKDGVKLNPIFYGDDREFRLRAGSQNVPGIVGFAEAVNQMNDEHILIMEKMRNKLIEALLRIDATKLNGSKGEKRICHNVNVTFRHIEGEALTLHASMRGLVCNTGSACYSQTLEPSHVITAIDGTHEEAHGSMRISVSKYTLQDDVQKAIDLLEEIVTKLRSFSPLTR